MRKLNRRINEDKGRKYQGGKQKMKKKKGQSYSLKNIKQLEKPLPNIITKRSRKHKYTKFLKNDIEGLNIIRY